MNRMDERAQATIGARPIVVEEEMLNVIVNIEEHQ